MKLLLLTFTLAVAVYARPSPDVSHIIGNGPRKEFTSYGAPTAAINGHYEPISHHPGLFPVHSDFASRPDFQLPIKEPIDFLAKDLPGFADFFSKQTDVTNLPTFAEVFPKQPVENIPPHNVKSYKQVYFYSAPETEEPQYLQIQFAPSKTKNTNVIFVKAPNPAPIIPKIVTPKHSLFEDKTKVYVFVKEPENLDKVLTLPAPIPVKTKPEVFIVKYKNQDEAQKVIASGVEDHEVGSTMSDVRDESAFVKTLNNNEPQNIDLSLENQIRYGGRSISPKPDFNVHVEDQSNSPIEQNQSSGSSAEDTGKDDGSSSIPNVSGQENSQNTPESSSDNEGADSGTTDVKKVTIQSLEEEHNQGSSDGVSVNNSGSSGAITGTSSEIQTAEGSSTSNLSILNSSQSFGFVSQEKYGSPEV